MDDRELSRNLNLNLNEESESEFTEGELVWAVWESLCQKI